MTARPSVVRTVLSATILVSAMGTAAIAGTPQAPSQDAAKAAMLPTISVRIDVTLSRYQGETKISSLPFSLVASAAAAAPGINTLAVNSGLYQARMRMGIDVPVGTSMSSEDKTVRTSYRSVGTNIDCLVTRLDENQFSARLDINDSSIFYSTDGDGKGAKNPDPAAFRTFNATNSVILRHGQTVLFGTSTDKVSGEVLKIEVTLNVVK
jgi:hypothetical protein